MKARRVSSVGFGGLGLVMLLFGGGGVGGSRACGLLGSGF